MVLIVDDSGLIRLVVSDELHKKGYDTVTASDGTKALRVAASKNPDLILLDVMLPGMDGFETCRRLKQDPATKNIPIVFMTARDKKEDASKGMQAGASAYLVKPFEGDELYRTVSKLIGNAYT